MERCHETRGILLEEESTSSLINELELCHEQLRNFHASWTFGATEGKGRGGGVNCLEVPFSLSHSIPVSTIELKERRNISDLHNTEGKNK